MKNKKDNIDKIRHSLSHLLAIAVLERFPGAKLAIGPTIENGFYYDFDLPRQLSADELPALEKKIKELIKQNLKFEKEFISFAEAKKIFSNQLYKLELIEELNRNKEKISIYSTSDPKRSTLNAKPYFIDLCAGPHVSSTKEISPDAFKLTRTAGAYWRGDEKNSMLTRIYGVAFNSKKKMDDYISLLTEAEKRDHRKLGQELKIFIIDDLVGKGLPIWLPNGTIIKNEIEKLAIEMENEYGYERVSTPHLAKEELYVKSGHLPYYADSMYPPMKMDDGTFYLKSMNCPHHHLIYKSEIRSWRNLPVRLAEYGTVYRNELSGTLAGLLRVRSLQMNDAHIYCRKDQIEEEFEKVLELNLKYFKIFGLNDYWFRLSKWNSKNKKKYINEPANWKFAEDILRKILKKKKVSFIEADDEAAFYGPKVDVQFKSVIGREESMSTIQLDFAAKKRFELSYVDKNGKNNNDVFVIHRAPLSTHERFMAFLIEHYAGAFPLWLAPVQAKILPISQKQETYGKKILEVLKSENIRVEMSDPNETLGKRIRETEMQKIPYILVVGEREMLEKSVNVRERGLKETKTVSIANFIKQATERITKRK